MLKLTWYMEHPWDFEHKNYVLLAYLSELDKSYAEHKLSPYLLWTEKMVQELKAFLNHYTYFKNSLHRDIIGFNWESGIIYDNIPAPESVDELIEIISYSEPLLESRVQQGYKLYKKFPQLLY